MTAPGPTATFRPVDRQLRSGPGPDDGPRLVAPGSVTDGRFGLFEIDVDPGGATPSVHFHTTFTESFYVLDGQVTLHVDGEEHTAGPGDFAFVPEGVHHGFVNRTDRPARMLILFTPGVPREAYFREIAALFRRPEPPTDDEIDAVARRHDQINVRTG